MTTHHRVSRWLLPLLAPVALLLVSSCGGPSGPASAGVPMLRGMVVGSDGRPAPNVEVRVEGTAHATRTGADGGFVLETPYRDMHLQVGGADTGAFKMDALEGAQRNDMRIALTASGEVASAELLRSGGGHCRREAIHRLVRPFSWVDPHNNPNPDADARGKIEIEEDEDGEQEFEVEVDRMRPGAQFVVFMQDHGGAWTNIGTLQIDGDGEAELEFDTSEGGDLPLGSAGLSDIFGLPVEVRSAGADSVYLRGTVPDSLRAMGGSFEGKRHLRRLGHSSGDDGSVKIKSKPRKHDERFYVKVEDLDPFTTYVVCVECPTPKPSAEAGTPAIPEQWVRWLQSRQQNRPAGAEATLSLPVRTVAPNALIEVPITVTTGANITYASFVVEYASAILHFSGVVPGTDAVAAGFTDANFNNTPPFRPATLDSNVVVQISSPSGSGSIAGNNISREIARLRFRVVGASGQSSPLLFDRSVPMGLPRTFLEVELNRTLTGEPALAFEDGMITISGGGPSAFDCVGFIVTDDEGEGKLKLKSKKGDRLPCGVENVGDLQPIVVGRELRVQVHLQDATGPVILEGSVPNFDDDDDDDDDDD